MQIDLTLVLYTEVCLLCRSNSMHCANKLALCQCNVHCFSNFKIIMHANMSKFTWRNIRLTIHNDAV